MNRDFFGAHEIARAVRRVRFGAQKSRFIRFVFPLAFQHRIRNCSTAKTREDILSKVLKNMVDDC